MANAKSIGWTIYAAGFVIWLFGYLSAGHPPVFELDVATPSSFTLVCIAVAMGVALFGP